MENLTIGSKLIAEERQKQIDKHGFTAERHVNHPEWYEEGQLINASQGLSQYDPNHFQNKLYRNLVPKNWDLVWWQKMCDRSKKERLIIAGALIAAELDRLNEIENDLEECTSCNEKFDGETMSCDDDSNWFCDECYQELAPIMKAEYEELKANGEID